MKEKLNADLEKTQVGMKIFDMTASEERIRTHEMTHRIKHLRLLMLVHSYLYYVLDDPIVSDDVWQSWANELTHLQNSPEWIDIKTDMPYDEAFKDWDGTTGHHLPFEDRWVISKALQIRRIHGHYSRG